MSKTTVVARVLEGDQLECQVVTPQGKKLTLIGKTTDVEPTVDGSCPLGDYQALFDNAWAYAKFTYLKVNLPTPDEQKAAAKRAKAHRTVAGWIADLADEPASVTRQGWCSGCFAYGEHQKVKRSTGQLPAYLCRNCGTPTSPCAGRDCDNMAVLRRGAIRVPRYCAEHRHETPGFEKAGRKMDSLVKYSEFLEYEQPNLARAGKLVGVGVTAFAVGVTGGLAAAPAIGGAVGTLVGGYSGAAATSYGLALLGGGSVAAGGMGMIGGTVVVAAVGGALGSAMGASVMNAYVREDPSFHIELLQGGQDVPVIVCNGFLSESGKGWGEWYDIVTKRYPGSPVYRVNWGAKELKALGALATRGAVEVASPAVLKQAAAAATKTGAKKLGPLGPVLLAADLIKNPWHVAKSRANKTGVIVADLLARTNAESYVLVGHSLGARAMVVAAQNLGTDPEAPRVEAAHLLGAAIGAKTDGDTLIERVDDAVYNYHSANDNVLKYLYGVAQAGQTAAGLNGFESSVAKLVNVDVSSEVEQHSDYHANVELL